MKEKKILDAFCKKVAACGMDIFDQRMAQDAAKDTPEWITMNGTHIHVGKEETPKEAGKKFAEKKEAERSASTSNEQKKTTSKSAEHTKKTSLKDLEVKLSKKNVPLSKKDQSIHNSMMDLIHEQHQYNINRDAYLKADKTMKRLEQTYKGTSTPEYKKAEQQASAALTKYSAALDKFRTLRTKFQKEHGIEITDKI